MQDLLFRKSLAIGIIILFIGASIAPVISGKINTLELDEKTLNNSSTNPNEGMSLLTFHTFDKTGEKQIDVNLPIEVANDIYYRLEELKHKIVYEPKSDETKALKNEFVEILYVNGLIPAGLSKDYVLSLLNPSWLNNKQKTSNTKTVSPFLKSFESGIAERISYFLQNFKNFFGKTILKNINKNTVKSPLNTDTAEASFCSISSGGNGATLPLFLLPRPRVLAFWTASSAVTMVGELLSSPVGKGFIAEGAQSGSMLGFTGLGITYAFPGYIVYGFVGYALYAKVSADSIEFYPPNNEPVISDENPPSGTENIPVSLSELSFRISDADGDLMDYTVTTEPNIGSGSGTNKNDGVYTVQISDLDYDKSYSWTVSVTDGKSIVENEFSFFTASKPFNPFDEGWQYRKMITIDHTKVAGDLNYFPVLISVTDVDLRDKVQDDGDDILFMDGVGVAYKLCHEIESFDGTSGKLVAWVRIPNLETNTDSVFYMYYGNNDCSNQESGFKVWDSNYKMVQHMDDTTASTVSDSTINGNTGNKKAANAPIQVDGKIGYAQDFDYTKNEYINCGNDVSLDMGTSDFTVELWTKTEHAEQNRCLATKRQEGGNYQGWWCWLNERVSGKISFNIRDYNSNDLYVTSTTTINNNNWYHLVCTYDRDASATVYINGNNDASASISGATNGIDTTNNQYLGCHRSPTSVNYDGIIDEIRISKTLRSANWIKTEYNNQNDPTSFFSFGPEESAP
jgi:hypothetical protein